MIELVVVIASMAAQGEEGGRLIYAMVARGTVVVAEQTAYTGNFRDIAAQCLQKLPAGDNRFTYTCDGHTFTFLIHHGYGIHTYSYMSLHDSISLCFQSVNHIEILGTAAYCVVASESAGREIPLAFLDNIKDEFVRRYAGGKADTAAANSLTRDFG